MTTRKITKFIIFDGYGAARVISRINKLKFNEVAYRLNIEVAPSWGRVAGDVNIQLPDAEVAVKVGSFPVHAPHEPPPQ